MPAVQHQCCSIEVNALTATRLHENAERFRNVADGVWTGEARLLIRIETPES
jgi:hypothetical protein